MTAGLATPTMNERPHALPDRLPAPGQRPAQSFVPQPAEGPGEPHAS